MKQIYLLPLLLLLAATVFSQQKSEFGFVVKAGTFTIPHEEQDGNSHLKKTYPAGTSASFGAYALQRLGGYFGISAELLYNFSVYGENERYDYRGSDGYSYWYDTDNKFEVNTFMMPVKIHFSPRKNGKLSFAAGLVPNFILGSEVSTIYKEVSGYHYSANNKDRVVRKDGSEGVQLLFTAGGQYCIDQHTAVGIDFTGSLSRNSTQPVPSIWDCWIGGQPYIGYYPFWMKSFTVSLRHNILR